MIKKFKKLKLIPSFCVSRFLILLLLFWQLFLDNLKSFIQQVESVNFINLFLTDLKWVE